MRQQCYNLKKLESVKLYFYYMFYKTLVKSLLDRFTRHNKRPRIERTGVIMHPHTTIIRHLRQGPMSLADLQPVTQVSLPTLRKAVQELINAQWINVAGQAETNGGRPAMLFGINPDVHLIIGVHLRLPGVRLITTDLSGQVLDDVALFQDTIPQPDRVVQTIAGYVAHIRESLSGRHVLGVGIASPGFTDPYAGDIISIGRVPAWQNFPICRRLEALLNVPARIANDVDCMAFAEFQDAGVLLDEDLIYVGFDEGVKVSIFLDGELHKGPFGNAGLVASPLVYVDQAVSRADVERILTMRGINAIFEERLARLDSDERQPYQYITATDGLRQRVHLILEAAAAGLSLCGDIGRLLIETLSSAAANVIFLVQPERVVFGGVLSVLPASLFAELEAAIRRRLPLLIDNHLTIQQARVYSANSAAVGATHHYLQNYLDVPDANLLHPPAAS